MNDSYMDVAVKCMMDLANWIQAFGKADPTHVIERIVIKNMPQTQAELCAILADSPALFNTQATTAHAGMRLADIIEKTVHNAVRDRVVEWHNDNIDYYQYCPDCGQWYVWSSMFDAADGTHCCGTCCRDRNTSQPRNEVETLADDLLLSLSAPRK